MAKRALIIGINYTGTEFELRGCITDALEIRSMLIHKLGYKVENIICMTDNSPDVLYPTRDNILAQIAKLVNDAKKGDQLFFSLFGSRNTN